MILLITAFIELIGPGALFCRLNLLLVGLGKAHKALIHELFAGGQGDCYRKLHRIAHVSTRTGLESLRKHASEGI